jgi:hypothetical protein
MWHASRVCIAVLLLMMMMLAGIFKCSCCHTRRCFNRDRHNAPHQLLLPLLPGIINAQLLSWLRPGSAVINGGRGKQLVEADLLAALDKGQVRNIVILILPG